MAWFAYDYHQKTALQRQRQEAARQEYQQALRHLGSTPWSDVHPGAEVMLEGKLRGALRPATGSEADPASLLDPIDGQPCLGYQLVYLRRETVRSETGVQSTVLRLLKRDIQLASRLYLETPDGVLALDTSQLSVEKQTGPRAVTLTEARSTALGAPGASLVRVLRLEPGDSLSLHGKVSSWSPPLLTLQGNLYLGLLKQNAGRWVFPRQVPVASFFDYMNHGPMLLVMILLLVGRIVLRASLSKR